MAITVKIKSALGSAAILTLCGCSSHEGVYLPDCIAYEGDRIHFADGHYAWDRFTDEILIGDDGEPIDAFPEFPRKGIYRVDGEDVYLMAENGKPIDHMYLHKINKRYYLLTEDQEGARNFSGELAKCMLVLQRED